MDSAGALRRLGAELDGFERVRVAKAGVQSRPGELVKGVYRRVLSGCGVVDVYRQLRGTQIAIFGRGDRRRHVSLQVDGPGDIDPDQLAVLAGPVLDQEMVADRLHR